MSRKTFVIDSSVLFYDPTSIMKFDDNDVVIHLNVLEELDKKKKQPTELGKNARAALRFLDSLKEIEGKGTIHEGLSLSNGTHLSIVTETDFPHIGGINNKIILTAKKLQNENKTVVFISKDFVSRIKAESIGIESEDYESLKYDFEELHKGLCQIDIDKNTIDHFYKNGEISLPHNFYSNQYVMMKSEENSSALGRYNPKEKKITSLMKLDFDIWGIQPLNAEQRCALDLLLREDINLVSLIGPAGTGKTLLALACGLRKVFDESTYSKILVSRPIVPLGQDIGYLPGTKEEKLLHWMQPVYDNLEFLCGSSENSPNETLSWILESKKIEMEAVTYIRGRTLPNMFMIIDEAQNLTPHEIKTIISRAGKGTKVILTGDPSQIDNPYLDKDSNGLTFALGKFRNQSIFGHMTLEKTERSELAAIAANLM
jgi:PhoH-like ATPase